MNKQNFKLRQICCFILLILFLLPASPWAAGTVSGTLFEDDGTTRVANVMVNFYLQSCGGPVPDGTFQTDGNGDYTGSLPAGDYYVSAGAGGAAPPYYVNEWYDGASGTIDCNTTTITVTDSLTTPNINFTLTRGGKITGSVFQINGTTAIADVVVGAFVGEGCGGGIHIRGVSTDAGGSYSNVVPPGTYYVKTTTAPQVQGFADEWWGSSVSSDEYDCNNAAAVQVTVDNETSGIDFHLQDGVTISGTVYESDGTTPIPNIEVILYGDKCHQNWKNVTLANQNGNYTFAALPGTYYVHCSAGNSTFVPEWYDGSSGTTDCNAASIVNVSSGNQAGIDFNLEPGAVISSTIVPGVTVTWTVTTGSYTAGSVIVITVRFSQAVWVSGTPQLILSVNRAARTGKIATAIAEYSSGSGTDTLIFLYKVAASDDIATMRYADLQLNGAQIQDINGNNVKLTAPPAPTPSVVNVTSLTESGSYPVGTAITINVRFSVLVWVKGMPQLVLNTGGAAPKAAYYTSGSGTNILSFIYTVAAGDNISSLDYWSEWALELNDGKIYSNLGIDADLDMPAPGAPGSLGYNTALGILGAYYPVYRFYSPILSKYLFTIDENEKEYLIANAADIWQIEGSAYYAYLPSQYDGASRQQRNTLQAVYRFYSESLQTHLFTIDENEKEYLIANVADIWRYEGPAFYVPAGNLEGTIPVYRFYSEDLTVHLFTADENEKNHLIDTAGDIWNFEGVAYYAYP